MDIIIIGAGFSGLNALAACIDTQPIHMRIGVIEATDRLGGHWNTVYPFVRLHNPYYNIGQYELVPASSSPSEIIEYAVRVTRDLCKRGNVTFFWKTRVLEINPHTNTLRTDTQGFIHAGRIINTVKYSINNQVQIRNSFGILPKDITHEMLLDAKKSKFVIVGSGKTAMDTIQYLSKHCRGERGWCTVIGGTPVCFVNRKIPQKVFIAKVFATIGEFDDYHKIMQKLYDDGYLLHFRDLQGTWRFGFSDHEEMRIVSDYVDEYLPNTHVQYIKEYDGELEIQLRDGRSLRFTDKTYVIDCRGVNIPTKARALDSDTVLNTFITEQTDTSTAYTFTDMFLSGGRHDDLRKFRPPPTNVSIVHFLKYLMDMSRLRKGAAQNRAFKEMMKDCSYLDLIQLWFMKKRITDGITKMKRMH